MRINTGRGWADLGPASAMGGLVGHRSPFIVALEQPRSPTGMVVASVYGHCPVCGERTDPGRYACSVEHQRIAYGNRSSRR